MNRWRRIASILWLALALLVGQQAAALHDLSHANGQLSHKHDSKPVSPTCDTHFAYVGLSGAVGSTLPSVLALDAPAPARLAFRSQAPPALL
jgi:hypothetical protein